MVAMMVLMRRRKDQDTGDQEKRRD